MINNIYSVTSANLSHLLSFDDNQRTVTKIDKKVQWTPEKMRNFKENQEIGDNDTTLTGITLNTTYNKSNISMSVDTPLKKKKPISEVYESSIRTPIKKTKKRDCTPDYSDDEEKKRMFKESPIDNNSQMEFNCNRNIQFNNFNLNQYLLNSYNNNPNQLSNYNLLKMNHRNCYNNDYNNSNQFYKTDIRFQKMSKSKFLQKIDAFENLDNNINSSSDFIGSEEIIDKIKGTFLLNLLENENCRNIRHLFFSVVEDNDLFNKITNIICYSFFDGFNNRSDIFFKFLSPLIYLEIVDQPINSFENNLSLLTNHVISLDPFYDNSQIDFVPDEGKYIFSLKGQSTLNTPNREILKFISSIRICLNLTEENRIRKESVKLEEIINIDFVKIKIFSDN